MARKENPADAATAHTGCGD